MIAFVEARELKSPDVFRWRLTSCWVKETFNTAPFFSSTKQSDRSWSSGIVKTREERKCHRGKRRDNDSRLETECSIENRLSYHRASFSSRVFREAGGDRRYVNGVWRDLS